MTAEQLSAAAAVVLSLALAYIPGLKDAYDKLANPYKVTLTGILLVVVAVGALAWSCRAAQDGFGACLSAGWEQYANALIAALIASQATYTLAVKPFKS